MKMLSDDDVRTIRREYAVINDKIGYVATNVIELAKRYNVSQETIRKVAIGVTYKEVV
jgi:Mor family transcriptional regulator